MIVEGQIHGGLADGVGMALMEVIAFDTEGNCLGGRCAPTWPSREGDAAVSAERP